MKRTDPLRMWCTAAGIDLDTLIAELNRDPKSQARCSEPDEPKRTASSKYGDEEQWPVPEPVAVLEMLLSNFDTELQYLHSEISNLRAKLRDHLPFSEFDEDSDKAKSNEGVPDVGYNDTGFSQSPTERKIARGLNDLVRARERLLHLRNIVVV